ncbi:putative pyridoxal phosphate-dependent acyltransferase [Pseudovibrio sp. Ad46]|uniref:aminotransferase class I/II-fold pyridoxal phosphate-dependent enzyme n=1 Tax=unclassified Pseudovibrio TaxID=2627060 RepID=UPI0007AEBA01|nr:MULTISPECIES: aminotransferase class I/II-fold pyridoxal phosphate-dependent enzyme [unclassified Pseudovibrio]KZK88652.1 putative pyridoxal phosphate-dependent acyltransferase [Pseudovibrio sp. Ad46]KZK91126.1 putative pyridoxal phosphate-dependent acyltransferase [Pseudovibrio sp. Ad5]KZL03825.1 putative pyridoxal phosphate-dependent acyltransferase [Pseudovibrio sp. W74]KZL09780.1 putative pyridoxal phosphate-dependent acyltransferase [Pseudovibrio sp. Ad14]
MAKSDKKKLSKDDRLNALSAVRRSKSALPKQKAAKPQADKAIAPKFADLPGFKEIRLQKAAADLLQINNPFFRAHDARAGATTLIDGETYLNFSSYDYLGLNGHEKVQEAAKTAVDHYGISASASRVVAGERVIHTELEKLIARMHGVQSSVAFVSGHATNVTSIGQLMQPDDLIIHDSYIHNSIVTGAKLSGAVRQSFPHNNFEALENILELRAHKHPRTLIVVEGVYSMDGDYPDLPRLIEIKKKYGAWLMVDEAHSIGILGETGRGLAEHFKVDPRDVDIWMGTFSKTLAGCGGYIAGCSDLVDYLKLTASGFVFSVGIAPPIAAAVCEAIRLLEAEPHRVQAAQSNGQYFLEKAQTAGLDTGVSQGCAVVPIMMGDSLKATVLAARLLDRGLNVLPIIYPAVPEKSARLRFFITSEHTEEQLDLAIELVNEEIANYDSNPISIQQVMSA